MLTSEGYYYCKEEYKKVHRTCARASNFNYPTKSAQDFKDQNRVGNVCLLSKQSIKLKLDQQAEEMVSMGINISEFESGIKTLTANGSSVEHKNSEVLTGEIIGEGEAVQQTDKPKANQYLHPENPNLLRVPANNITCNFSDTYNSSLKQVDGTMYVDMSQLNQAPDSDECKRVMQDHHSQIKQYGYPVYATPSAQNTGSSDNNQSEDAVPKKGRFLICKNKAFTTRCTRNQESAESCIIAGVCERQ